MSKFTITVVTGIAAVYPHGQNAKDMKILTAGQTLEGEVGPHPQQQRYAPLRDAVAEDMAAPAAGVATDEPFGERDGVLKVTADGKAKVRLYAGSSFTERVINTGDEVIVPVTESNRITLAVYSA